MIEVTKADSTGRRNTVDHILLEQQVESLCRCSPPQRFLGARVQRIGNGAQFFGAVLAEIRALGKVLPDAKPGRWTGISRPTLRYSRKLVTPDQAVV